MTTIQHGDRFPDHTGDRPYSETYKAASHFRDRDHEFDSVKLGVWLFLSTEVLLFSGMFVGYAVLRLLHIEPPMHQVAGHQFTHVAVVFDQQDAGLHGIKWWSNRYRCSEFQSIFSVFAGIGELWRRLGAG
jgi:hypothetical protein